MQAGSKVDLHVGAAAAHNILHNARDASGNSTRPGVNNMVAIAQAHSQSISQQRIDLS